MVFGNQSEPTGGETRDGRNRALPGGSGGLGRRSFLTAAGAAAAVPLVAGSGRAAKGSGSRRRIEIDSTGSKGVGYEFTATGAVEPVRGDAEGNDSVTENDDGSRTATGAVGSWGRDTYTFEGRITSFSPTSGEFDLRVDGVRVDPAAVAKKGTLNSLPAASDVLGGGKGYPDTVPKSAATTVVSDVGGLERALNGASSGDVVYVDPSATIAVGKRELTVPSGVTLASNRGVDGAKGGEIRADEVYGEGPLHTGNQVRITGLRVTAPNDEYIEYRRPVHSGVVVEGKGCEIDNVEIAGFTYSAVKLLHSARVHHSHIHSNPMDGLGYGVLCIGGDSTLVEYNRFNYNRHSVANQGTAGYEVRYNHFGDKAVAYQVGTHRPGGSTLEIHHNTFVPTKHINSGEDPESHVSIRGVPDDVADIHHNWFHNPRQPAPGRGEESIIQPHSNRFRNVNFDTNHYGEKRPSDDTVGCPR
ncbi:right-handed parallel beta-helix repeat-containing protein [Halosimplex litoreum]|uniref:Right-handed parallel beta-helix repeat-containing protein n=1 Tax=Halosimplex litoreum TaxID=1198301 RepID=A0A7T3G032_9EURY|nr:right-handed parallel beta-helix repeat-containing protein [Halosimplex litoreum]QPV63757.1 right-handed parallel beta-helix repeat-containing protein [Halosimplex litoreum]